MELRSCIARINHQDSTLTIVIVRPSCLIACSDYEPNESDYDDDNDSLDALNLEVRGSREWFGNLGV